MKDVGFIGSVLQDLQSSVQEVTASTCVFVEFDRRPFNAEIKISVID